jgi:hypothetical protein
VFYCLAVAINIIMVTHIMEKVAILKLAKADMVIALQGIIKKVGANFYYAKIT